MKFLVVLALAVACAHAQARSGEASAQIVRSASDVRPDGFEYSFETDNGIRASSNGVVKNLNAENPSQEVTGEFSYPAPDGSTYSVTYVADENGFQPQGAHLPTSPPIPEAILRAIAYNEAHPQGPQGETKVYTPAARPVVSAFAPAPAAQAFNPFGRKQANKYNF